jgi:hypothetical protein
MGPIGRLGHLIRETLESVAVSGLMLFLGVENADVIQEAFKFTQPRSVHLVASWPFHRIDGTIHFPLLVVALERARMVRVALLLLLLLLLSYVQGCLLTQGLLVSNGEHCFRRPGVFHGGLMDQGRVPESLFKLHNNRLVVDLQDDVSLITESLDELPEELSLLLDDAG